MTDQPEKMDLTSMDVAAEKKAQLKQLFPEAFTEDKIDFEQLQRALGEWIEPGKERYGLTWPGKAECMRVIQAPSIATLKPDVGESVDFDTTENIFIEGDNLEVLKLLQKSYFGKIKMIYIDPPYNTGNEFIYPDKFAENLDTYLAYTGQADDQGRRFSTNTDAGGRYHANWLTMMYPRLYLARNLLSEDGAIFISIDDNEQANLKRLCDLIFGEENFVASCIWQKVYAPKNSARYFSEDHDYVLVYAKEKSVWEPGLLPRTAEQDALYKNPDKDPRGSWMSDNLTARNFYGKGSYSVTSPNGTEFSNPRGTYWRISKEKFDELNDDNRIWWGENKGNMPRLKRFLSEVSQGRVPQTLWSYKEVGHTQDAKKELLEYVDFDHTENVLNSVKPIGLLKHMLQIGTRTLEHDIVLDFFSGSAPTGHGVMTQNLADNGNRRFLLVQLPEPLPTPEEKARTIADFGKSRLRKVGQKIRDERAGQLDLGDGRKLDLGFKVFKLAKSNFKLWEGDREKIGDLTAALEAHINHIDPAASPEDILHELLLKAGFDLTAPIKKQSNIGEHIYSVADGALLICLDKNITPELIDALADADPIQVICLDEGFKGNDQLKTNAVQTFKSRTREGEEPIVFRTV